MKDIFYLAGKVGIPKACEEYKITKKQYLEMVRKELADFEGREVITHKVCPKCKKNKKLSMYFPDLTNALGVYSYCKKCHKKLKIKVRDVV